MTLHRKPIHVTFFHLSQAFLISSLILKNREQKQLNVLFLKPDSVPIFNKTHQIHTAFNKAFSLDTIGAKSKKGVNTIHTKLMISFARETNTVQITPCEPLFRVQ